jgi:hypothetical protein
MSEHRHWIQHGGTWRPFQVNDSPPVGLEKLAGMIDECQKMARDLGFVIDVGGTSLKQVNVTYVDRQTWAARKKAGLVKAGKVPGA